MRTVSGTGAFIHFLWIVAVVPYFTLGRSVASRDGIGPWIMRAFEVTRAFGVVVAVTETFVDTYTERARTLPAYWFRDPL
jgi:hypothetical protein